MIFGHAIHSMAVTTMIAVAWLPQNTTVGWQERLGTMDPGDPMAYFDLAEEMADAARDDAAREQARHLFALAGALDPGGLGRSTCLALADLEDDEHAKRKLLALASLLDERAGGLGREQFAGQVKYEPEAALAVADAFANYRQGRGGRALAALRTPGAMELLETYGGVFRGGATRFVEDCRLYRNRRPQITEFDLIRMLRFEAALLAGDNRSWSGEQLLNRGRPLIEVDPDRLEDSLAVDVTRPCYRNGQWVECR